ncbi:hypothetical protein [Stagnihabitans tardus]|uniref:Uncharacterized protein n=1 Tax=Stagnihabitans tardus TaxID=2699202 RepID=A0AAE5BSX5_9RHOB|nr:hypothetical protein [Stagnihabitans tardus]NBZ85971.1 hypothetical protein [Stagnihabitans tardus]
MKRLADFIRSGRHQTEPIPDDIRKDGLTWLAEQLAASRARYSNPMEPPWLFLPDIPAGSIGWRMGPGEEYWMDFLVWFRGLSGSERGAYMHRVPEPQDWVGFYDSLLVS